MQDTFARATHSAYAAGRPSAARDDRVSCIQWSRGLRAVMSRRVIIGGIDVYISNIEISLKK